MRFDLSPFALPVGYGESIVPVKAIKDHIGLLQCDDDGLLELYRDAGVDMVERYCGLRLAPCEGLVWRADALQATIDLASGPITAINAINYLDETGALISLEVSDWRIAGEKRIALLPGRQLPENVAAGVSVTFDAGYALGACPPVVARAVAIFAAHLYHNREGYEGGLMSGALPPGFTEPLKLGGYRPIAI